MSGFGPKTANTFSVPVPINYVAGVGRGATGFTTRSDIGPARPAVGQEVNFGAPPPGYVAGRGRGMGELAKDQGELSSKQIQDEADRGDYSESNYDSFAGYSERLFTYAAYDQEDVEADQIYESVDEFMDGRHKRKREQQLLEAQNAAKKNSRPKIADQFADLKRELSSVSAEEWDAIPDVGDQSLKHKQKSRKEMFTPAPDYLLDSANKSGQFSNVLDPTMQRTGGFETPSGMASAIGGAQTVTGMAEARGTVLTLKLDKMSDSVSGQTVVDPKGYLTDLNSMRVTSDAEVGDIKKARTLLGSVITTNPKHGPGWIAAARVEEFAGKMVQARKTIRQGCEAVPDSEDVWLEAARLHTVDNAKAILASAVKHLPTSVKIWLKAAELEADESRKRVVLRRALEFIPNSVQLWKTAIELENVNDARIMLARAVECVPHSVEMWLALAKLESHENARKVLNQAREANPTEPSTWITAAKLEEAHGNGHLVDKIIERMMVSLTQYEVVISRDQWLKEAEAAEFSGAKLVCAAIVKNSLHLGVEQEDRLVTWIDDADGCLNKTPPAVETARAIYATARKHFPHKKNLWLASAMLEKDHGTPESLEEILKEAVKNCPTAETLWLMAAKEKWLAGNVPGARAILIEAFEANSDSEQIWLAAVKLEWENNEIERSRVLLSKARERAPSARVYLKSALLEREAGDIDAALKFLDEGIQKYPNFAKFYMMAGQICSKTGGPGVDDPGKARGYFQAGLQQCPDNATLWRLAIRLEESVRGTAKARSMAEMARLRLPSNDEVWLESVRLERRAKNEKLAESVMAKAMQECPQSGLLWAEEVIFAPKAAQKQKSVDAIKKCDNDPHVVLAVARLFDKDRKYAKARKWFERAAALNPKLGDSWAYWFAFELRMAAEGPGAQLPPVDVEQIAGKCEAASPNQGELWCGVAKDTANRRKDVKVILKKCAEMILSARDV